MALEDIGPTPSEYIRKHLVHLTNKEQDFIVDFTVINIDSVVVSSLLGALICFVMLRIVRHASAGVPGRFQAAFELLVEYVDQQAKANIRNAASRKVIAPMALVVALWVFMMNFMDLIPVDLLPHIWGTVGPALGLPHYLRVVPTASLATTLGLAFAVLLMCLYYNVKIKGWGGWGHELVSAPFGTSKNIFIAIPLGIFNFSMQVIEYIAKTVSHGMRLFGNMFAGELVFMLIALLGGFAALSLGGGFLFLGHLIAGTAWAIFHIFVITLQAFIFMMLALIYLGQAHDAH